MKPTFYRLMVWEWRRLWAERINVLLLTVWIGLLVVAGWQGTSMTHARHAEIEDARLSAETRWQERRTLLAEIEAGRVVPGEFGDPRSPTGGVLASSNAQPVVLIPTALAPMAAGASELASAVKHAGMVSKVHVPPDNLENPANRLAGRFDLLFVVSALMPLFVLAFAFDVLARERELNIWPLLAGQPVSPAWIVGGRLALHFLLLWLPLMIVATLAVILSRTAGTPWFSLLMEVGCWLVLAGAYLIFWQALAAWINFQKWSAATNALMLCGAWLMLVLLIPAGVQVAVQMTAAAPDRLGLILAQREVDIVLHKRADVLREEFYGRHGYERPKVKLNEYDTFYIENVVPRAFAADEELRSVFEEIDRQRQMQSKRTDQLSWLSPALAFRRASEYLAGVSPVQQGMLIEAARQYQQAWRSHYGAKLASMTPLTLQDYDSKPTPPVVRLPLVERVSAAGPAFLAVVLASGLSWGWAAMMARRKRGLG